MPKLNMISVAILLFVLVLTGRPDAQAQPVLDSLRFEAAVSALSTCRAEPIRAFYADNYYRTV